jgi:hypothetical protein
MLKKLPRENDEATRLQVAGGRLPLTNFKKKILQTNC